MSPGHWQDADTAQEMIELLGDRFGPREHLVFGIACCRRVEYLISDKSLKKVLGRLKKLAHVPVDRRKMMDIYNTTCSVFSEKHTLFKDNRAEVGAVYTLMCASSYDMMCNKAAYPGPHVYISAVQGNFRSALEHSEGLTLRQVLPIECEFIKQIAHASMTESGNKE